MSGFLYYLPAANETAKLADVRALRLGYTFDDDTERHITTRGVPANGPDGGSGAVVAHSRHVTKVGYYPDEQTWRRVPIDQPAEAEKQIPEKTWPWVGFYTRDPPKPEELQRRQPLDGHRVRLGDGHEWLIPVARGCGGDAEGDLFGYNALPSTVGLDDKGNWTRGDVITAHAELWRIAERWWDTSRAAITAVMEGEEIENRDTVIVEFADQADAALVALSANYRLGKAEVVLLELFTERVIGEILQALVDWPTWKELFKKKLEKETKAGPC